METMLKIGSIAVDGLVTQGAKASTAMILGGGGGLYFVTRPVA